MKARWGKLTDDDINVIAGKRQELSGRLQAAYGLTKEQAERQIERFELLHK